MDFKPHRGKIVNVKVSTYQFGKKTKVRETVHKSNAVVILPIDASERIILIQQWRGAVGEIFIELPAGKIEEGEEPAVCAKRELQEETGFACHTLIPFSGFYCTPGFCDEYLHLFIAKGLHPSPLPQDEDEAIDLLPMSLKEAMRAIENNEISDCKTVAGILKYFVTSPINQL